MDIVEKRMLELRLLQHEGKECQTIDIKNYQLCNSCEIEAAQKELYEELGGEGDG